MIDLKSSIITFSRVFTILACVTLCSLLSEKWFALSLLWASVMLRECILGNTSSAVSSNTTWKGLPMFICSLIGLSRLTFQVCQVADMPPIQYTCTGLTASTAISTIAGALKWGL